MFLEFRTRIYQNPPKSSKYLVRRCLEKGLLKRCLGGFPRTYSQADRLHGPCLVYSFYLHLVDFYGFHVGKYTSPMDPTVDGSEILLTTKHVGKGNCCKEWDIYHITRRRISSINSMGRNLEASQDPHCQLRRVVKTTVSSQGKPRFTQATDSTTKKNTKRTKQDGLLVVGSRVTLWQSNIAMENGP